jgi:hypothetical protein
VQFLNSIEFTRKLRQLKIFARQGVAQLYCQVTRFDSHIEIAAETVVLLAIEQ